MYVRTIPGASEWMGCVSQLMMVGGGVRRRSLMKQLQQSPGQLHTLLAQIRHYLVPEL